MKARCSRVDAWEFLEMLRKLLVSQPWTHESNDAILVHIEGDDDNLHEVLSVERGDGSYIIQVSR